VTSDASSPLALTGADVLAGRVVDIAGIPTQLEASSAHRAGAVAALFRHATVHDDPPRCALRFTADHVAVPAIEAKTIVGGVELWRPRPDELVLRSDEGITARVSNDEIVVGGDAESLPRAFRFIALLAVTHLLAQHGHHVLHAGAIVADDAALLVLGDTGSGKSTLVYGAHRLGWPVLADDLVALHRRDDDTYAAGLPRPITIPSDVVVEEIPGSRAVPDDARDRTELPVGTLAGGARLVAGVIVTGRSTDRRSERVPMSRLDTTQSVLRASASLADRAVLPELFALASELARRPAWRLLHGTDPDSRLDDAGRELAAIRDRLRDDESGRASAERQAPAPP
jgi:hypothetical protein